MILNSDYDNSRQANSFCGASDQFSIKKTREQLVKESLELEQQPDWNLWTDVETKVKWKKWQESYFCILKKQGLKIRSIVLNLLKQDFSIIKWNQEREVITGDSFLIFGS